MPRMQHNGDVFESGAEMVDVTSMSRPDTSWRFTDAAGHEHRWYADGQPADTYSPSKSYDLPTLIWVVDGTRYYDDGEPYEVGHYECTRCAEHVSPQRKSDDTTQYIAGLRWFRINGEPVSEDEFKRRLPRA